MDIKTFKIYSIISAFLPLAFACKKNGGCLKEGYSYTHTSSLCWYSPALDSIPLGETFTLEASVPKTFLDHLSNTSVHNSSPIIHGSLGIGMLSPIFQAAADSFELIPLIGKVIKDTINFSAGSLKGFRTIEWNGASADSFRMKIIIKPQARGVFSLALRQQGYKDKDCAVFKYFLNVGNEQHLHYWAAINNGVIDDLAQNHAYCFKVY